MQTIVFNDKPQLENFIVSLNLNHVAIYKNRGHQTFCSEGRIAARLTAADRMQIAKKYTIIYNFHRHELSAINNKVSGGRAKL